MRPNIRGFLFISMLVTAGLFIVMNGCNDPGAEPSNGSTDYIKTIEHGGHTYIKFYSNSGIHDPDCEARDRKKEESE
jgi:hypothetical protein